MSDLNPGKYRARITGPALVENNNFNEPEMRIPVVILNGDTPTAFNRSVTVSLGEKYLEEGVGKLNHAGWNGDFAQPAFSATDIDVEMWLSKKVSPKTGKPYQNWTLPRPPRAGRPATPADQGTLERLASAARALKPASPPPAPPPQSAPSMPPPIVHATKESVWAEVAKEGMRLGKNELEYQGAFVLAARNVAKGRSENQFTPQDWLAVRAAAMLEMNGIPV